MSVTSVSQTTVGTVSAATSTSKLASDYESFITLLVAQVKHQDPLEPMESSQFVTQLAQLTQVEQSVRTNSQMEALRQQLALNAALSETALIGREVTMPSEEFVLDETGGRFAYRLETAASTVQAQIRDADGILVAVIDGLSGNAGEMIEVNWDGIGADGLPAEPGRYKLAIAATGADGTSAGSYQSYSSGAVIAVDYDAGSSWLRLADGRRVASGEIISAR